jgi:hypothetical protein
MTKDAKMSRLLVTFNILPESDKNVVIQFSESILHKDDGDNGSMTRIISNSSAELHTNGQYIP